MSWKNTFGQIIGIFIGVTLGSAAIRMVLGSNRQPEPPPQQQYEQAPVNVGQRPAGLFDQAVANMQTRPQQ